MNNNNNNNNNNNSNNIFITAGPLTCATTIQPSAIILFSFILLSTLHVFYMFIYMTAVLVHLWQFFPDILVH